MDAAGSQWVTKGDIGLHLSNKSSTLAMHCGCGLASGRRYDMGMYAALMKEIEKGLEDIKSQKGKVVEVTRSGKIVSKPFRLFQDEETSNQLQVDLASK